MKLKLASLAYFTHFCFNFFNFRPFRPGRWAYFVYSKSNYSLNYFMMAAHGSKVYMMPKSLGVSDIFRLNQ